MKHRCKSGAAHTDKEEIANVTHTQWRLFHAVGRRDVLAWSVQRLRGARFEQKEYWT